MAKAIKNKLWKDNTSVKSWFAYKQYFKKKKKTTSINLSSGNLARIADPGILICNAGSHKQLISVHELHSHL